MTESHKSEPLAICAIQKYPTSIDHVHESLFRSYHILSLIEKLLTENVPGNITLKVMRELRDIPQLSTSSESLKKSAL